MTDGATPDCLLIVSHRQSQKVRGVLTTHETLGFPRLGLPILLESDNTDQDSCDKDYIDCQFLPSLSIFTD